MTYKITPRLINLLRNELKRCGNNTAALARKIDINPSYIFKYLNGTVKNVQAGTWIKLCQYFPELDERPLYFRGNTTPIRMAFRAFPLISSEALVEASRSVYLPISDYAMENQQDMLHFSKGQNGDFAVQVSGVDMLPQYPEGTVLLVRPNVKLNNGNPVLAILQNGEILFRIFFEINDKIYLIAYNDNAKFLSFDKNDYKAIIGIYLIVQSIRDEVEISKQINQEEILRKINSC